MKKSAMHVLLLAGLATQLLIAQEAAQINNRFAGTNFVSGDDDEQIQIVPIGLAAGGPKTYHGGEVMKSVQSVPIFLGKRWAESAIRERQASLADVLSGDNVGSQELQSHAIKTLQATPYLDDFTDLSGTAINDLAIQHKLVDLLESKAVPSPTASTIYVVYLSPEINSTLGSHKAGTDYLAYHNLVNLAAGEVRYVVVPYNQNATVHRAAAARACSEAALNPRGFDGVY